ncbi:MAG TPA: hypothetical protein PLI09_23200 [Candidatus Hydrogenedentes bacterium]|nr:hypothetical protein [Candidatus Hydrogenedentota bacterium]
MVSLPAGAWGPATHAYIITRILGTEDLDAMFGSLHPDFGAVAQGNPALTPGNPALASRLKHLTHHEYYRLAPSPFAEGFSTHNSGWGADAYAHRYIVNSDESYSAKKIHQLAHEFNISDHKAEDIFELAMDVAVILDQGPDFARKIGESARIAGPRYEQALVDAFAAPLAEALPDLSLTEAEPAIRWSSRIHRQLIQAYGIHFCMGKEYLMRKAPPYLARHLECSPEEAARYFDRAVELASDFKPEMDSMARAIKTAMEKEKQKRASQK